MNKKQFLEELEKNLTGLKEEDIKEILDDYKEHFKVGKKKKRKETEIADSLGDPKEIAKEAKEELGEVNYFKKDLRNLSETIEETAKNFYNSIRKKFTEKKDKKPKKYREKQTEKKSKKKFWTIFGLFWLNFLLMIWLFLSLYTISFSFFIVGGALIISGVVSFLTSLFILIYPTSTIINTLSISGIFGSIGLFCLGLIWIMGTSKMTRGFSWILNKYTKWNRRVSKK